MEFNGHELITETINKHDFGFQEVNGYLDGNAVISLADGALGPDQKWMWRVTSSRTVPTSLDEAEAYQVLQQMCIKKAKELDNFYRCNRGLMGKHLLDVDSNEVFTLIEINPNDVFVLFTFEVLNIKSFYKRTYSLNDKDIEELVATTIEISPEEFLNYRKQEIIDSIKELQEKLQNID